jgi:predicted metal-dependent enzyme (double-stranded beta helix superfamily)
MSFHVSRRTFMAGGSGLALSLIGSARAHGLTSPAAGPVDLERLVEEVERAGKQPDAQPAVHAVLERAVSEPGALLAAIGEPREAGIHTLHRAPDLTILNVVWAPLMVLLPHNHKMWATIGIYTGREDNILWRSAGARVGAFGAAALSEKDVFDLPDDAIHSVVNPIPRLTAAIHVYGGDFFAAARSEWDSETLRERPFDIEGARRVFRESARRFDCAATSR